MLSKIELSRSECQDFNNPRPLWYCKAFEGEMESKGYVWTSSCIPVDFVCYFVFETRQRGRVFIL